MSLQTLKRLSHRVFNLFDRGTITHVNDAGPVQLVQVTYPDGKVQDDVPVYALFGFGGNPPLNSGAIVLFLAGNRSSPVCIAVNNSATRIRNLKSGETVVGDFLGQKVYFSQTGIQIIGNGNLPLVISGITQTTLQSNLIVQGTIAATGDITAGTISLQNHLTSDVQAGTGISGGPVPET